MKTVILRKGKEVTGFDKDDLNRYQEFLSSTAHIIIELGRQGT